jgi:hypothetical protein
MRFTFHKRMTRTFFTCFSLLMTLPVFAGTIDFTPHGTQPGLNLPLRDSSDCSGCHKGGNVTDDPINMPYLTWVGSMKANATRDPLFWAALDVANNDLPGVGDFCFKCHSPMGWYRGRVVKPEQPGDPLVDGANGCELFGEYSAPHSGQNDYEGISCHFCHRMDENGPMGESQIIGNGSVWVDDQACGNSSQPCRKGPYDYSGGGTPPHAWEYSDFIQSAEFCGACHNVSSPTVDDGGVVEPYNKLWHNGVETALAMPIERTYSEWQSSDFADLIFLDGVGDDSGELPALKTGENCQTCHMPNSESIEARACVFDPLNGMGEGRRIGNLSTHQFAGGNSWIPQVLKGEYGAALEANDLGRNNAFDLTTSYALNMLQNQSALLEATVDSASTDELALSVKVTNLTGHKLPTGYPEGRRMWLNVVVRDNSNTVIYESGAYDAGTGVLTEDAQIKIYETLQGIWDPLADGGNGACEITDGDGDKMFHFARNNCVLKDNRIPPLGFSGASNIEMIPVGISYPARPGHPGQVVNYDVTSYQVPLTGQTGPFSVEATLKYQTASKEYIDFLEKQAVDNSFPSENLMCDRSWTEGPANLSRGAFMKSLWENYGRSAPVDMVMDFVGGISP